MARERTPQAIEALTAALDNPRERVAAAIALLDRAWGKATTVLAADPDAGPTHIQFTWAPAQPQPVAATPVIDAEPPQPLALVWQSDDC
jgi:hypothetical protein